MKYLIVILFILPLTANAQKGKRGKADSILVYGMRQLVIRPVVSDSSFQIPFTDVQIKDVRLDTNNLGTLTRQISTKYWVNYELKTTQDLSHFLKNSFIQMRPGKSNQNDSLLLCIKDFQFATEDPYETGGQLSDDVIKVKITIDVYRCNQNLLFPLFRHTSENEYFTRKSKSSIDGIVNDEVTNLLRKLTEPKFTSPEKSTGLKTDSLLESYKKTIPILSESNTHYKKGIYTNLKEFLNNQPSITEFTIEKSKTATTLYDKEAAIVNPSKIFGYYDDEVFWKVVHYQFLPLIKKGNSFYVIEAGNFHLLAQPMYSTNPGQLSMNITNDILSKALYEKNNVPLFIKTISLETGKIF